MGVTTGTCKGQVHRALQLLRAETNEDIGAAASPERPESRICDDEPG